MRPRSSASRWPEHVDFAIEHVEPGALDPRLVHLCDRLFELRHRHAVLGLDPARLRPRLFELLHRDDPLVVERLRACELGACELELRLQRRDRPLRGAMGRMRGVQPASGPLVDEIAFGREPFTLGPSRIEPGFELLEQQALLPRVDPGDDLIEHHTVARCGGQLHQPPRHAGAHGDEVAGDPRVGLVHMGDALPDLDGREPRPGGDHRNRGGTLKQASAGACHHFNTGGMSDCTNGFRAHATTARHRVAGARAISEMTVSHLLALPRDLRATAPR